MSNEEMSALGRHMRRARVKYKSTLRSLAADLGVDVSYLSRIENGREKPSQKVIDAYIDHFRMNSDELNRVAGRISVDVERYLVNKPDALRRVRAEMEGEMTQ